MRCRHKSWLVQSSVLLLGLFLATSPAAGAEVEVQLDGWPLEADVPPRIDQGRTLVPFRALAEALGVEVEWDGETRTVHARDAETRLEMPVDQATAFINGRSLELDTPPRIDQGRTLVPLRVFSETFGAEVNWDDQERLVTVASPPRDLEMMGFYAIRAFHQRQYIPYLDQVAFGWAQVDTEGQPVLDDRDFFWPEPAGEIGPAELIAASRETGTAPYLMVFAEGYNGELEELLADDEARSRAARELTALAAREGFQGLLLDFEGLGWARAEDDEARRGEIRQVRDQFTRLVQEVAGEAGARDLALALALHPPDSAYQGYDYGALGQYADQLVVMAYDYTPTGKPEPPERVERSLQLALEEVEPGKLILGISLASEDPETLRPLVGLAAREGLSGIALWRLGLVREAHWQELGELIQLPEPGAVPGALAPDQDV